MVSDVFFVFIPGNRRVTMKYRAIVSVLIMIVAGIAVYLLVQH